MKTIDKIREMMKKLDIDGLFLTNLYNIRYITGFTGTTGLALISKDKNYFFSDFRYKEQGKLQVEKNGFEFVEVARGAIDLVGEYIKKCELKKVGFEDLDITVDYYMNMKKVFDVELVGVQNNIKMIRMCKTEKEIEVIKKAIQISDIAFTETLNIIKEGVTEKEIAAYLEYIQRKNGAESTSFATIVASGYRSAMPHGVASDKKIGKNEFITMDFGCYYDGYVSDMTRTIFYGDEITEKHKEVYNTVLEAQLLGVNNIKSGMKTNEIDELVRDYISNKGYGEYFGHGLGHGIGLEIHEMPYLSPKSNIELVENMIVTIEPGIYLESFGGVRIEDDVVITKKGCEILNKTTKELIVLKGN